MTKIKDAITWAYKLGKDEGLLPVDLRLLIKHNENFRDQMEVFLKGDEELRDFSLFESQVKRLLAGEPLEYIIHEAEFLNRHLYVDENVLIPRSETQELIALITETVSDYFEPRNFLAVSDIGTGSGAIAIALKDSFPNWIVTASDVSVLALDVARRNIKDSNLPITCIEGDALTPYIERKMALDIIVSNPPYIENLADAQKSVVDYEPMGALALEKGDSVYDKVFRDLGKVKKGPLLIYFEISPDLQEWLTQMTKSYYPNAEIGFHKDLNGLVRFMVIYLE